MSKTTLYTEEQIRQVAEQIARQYLQTEKGWSQEEFSLEIVRREGTRETPVVVVNGVHISDLGAKQRGGGQSVQLHIDVQKQMVVCEPAYQ